MMSDVKRLHPATIILNVLKEMKGTVYLIFITLITLDFIYFLLFLLAYALLIGIIGTLSWYRFSYWVTDDALHIEYGIFKRTKRTISKNRIQSIDLTENIVHRIFKLVRVQIETASSGMEAEASLAAVSLDEGETLRAELKYKQVNDESGDIEEEDKNVKKVITTKQLLLAGITSGGVGIILSFMFIALIELEELIPENVYDYTFSWFVSTSLVIIILLVLVVLFVVWLLSVGLTFIRNGKFTIKIEDNELLITRGLIEKKQLTIPLHRIQAIGVEENIFRQPFGYASIHAEVAGGSTSGNEGVSTMLFPLMHKREVPEFIEQFVPGFSWDPEQVEWVKPPKKALKFYLFRSGIAFLIMSFVVLYFFPNYSWITFIILALMLGRGWLSYKDAGFYVNDNRLLLRYRKLKRVTVMLYHKRVQAFEKEQNPIQRKDYLTTMKVSILSNLGGKHYQIKEVDEGKVNQLSDFYFSK